MRLWTFICAAVAVCLIAVLVISPRSRPIVNGAEAVSQAHSWAAAPLARSARDKQIRLIVMAVGGSSAQGYDDPQLDGYLARAMARVSSALNIPITFVNKARSGDIPTMLAPQFDPLVHKIKPDIVILSWGLLNSIARRVPMAMFQKVIRSETGMALKEGADVWVVTPPVTLSTYDGHDVKPEAEFADREMLGARATHSTHVHVFDLLDAMKTYLANHHQSYKPYESNNWHMNRAGHILAGRILADAILKRARSIGLTS